MDREQGGGPYDETASRGRFPSLREPVELSQPADTQASPGVLTARD